MNLLLADDDVDDCLFFKEALEELPINSNFSVVNNGEQLMKFLTDSQTTLPDILFLDLNMPRKNGMECLIEIRQNQKLKTLPGNWNINKTKLGLTWLQISTATSFSEELRLPIKFLTRPAIRYIIWYRRKIGIGKRAARKKNNFVCNG